MYTVLNRKTEQKIVSGKTIEGALEKLCEWGLKYNPDENLRCVIKYEKDGELRTLTEDEDRKMAEILKEKYDDGE